MNGKPPISAQQLVSKTKTDSQSIGLKIDMRRAFLEHCISRGLLHQPFSILDCFGGYGDIWKAIDGLEYSRTAIDIREIPGVIKADSNEWMRENDLDFDVIDVDSYGDPWPHVFVIAKKIKKPCIVFCTHGIRIMQYCFRAYKKESRAIIKLPLPIHHHLRWDFRKTGLVDIMIAEVMETCEVRNVLIKRSIQGAMYLRMRLLPLTSMN